jgi:hypothetical protein
LSKREDWLERAKWDSGKRRGPGEPLSIASGEYRSLDSGGDEHDGSGRIEKRLVKIRGG